MIDARGKLVLIVDNTFSSSLGSELARLEQDLRGDGWEVLRYDVSPNDDVVFIKSIITGEYQDDPQNVKAVFFFGNIAVPYSGNTNPDGHDDHTGDAVAVGRATGARVVAPYELSLWLQEKGLQNVTGMNPGGTVAAFGIGNGVQSQAVADAVNHDPTKVPQELKDDPTKALEYMNKVVAEADRKLGTGVHPIEHSSLNLIGRIYKTLEQFHRQNGTRQMGGEPFYILVDAVNATQDPARSGYVQITINGQSSNTELAEAFRAALLKAEPFKEGWTIEAQQYTAIKENMGFNFTIKKGKG